jgi:hypothetical protein
MTRAGKTRKYHPAKYYRGLTRRKAAERHAEIERFGAMGWRDPRAYKGFQTDIGVVTRPSSYTQQWKARFPDATSLEQKAKATGVPLKYIRASYNRGMAAWRTGHRPGASQQAWGYARVHSFLLKGKTFQTTDSDLARAAIATSKGARQWFSHVD